MHAAPEVVTFHLWGVPRRNVPWALSRMASRRTVSAAPRQVAGLRFAKLLGTGRGRTFTPTDADPLHWALLASWDTDADAAAFESSRVVASWNAHSAERWLLRLSPITSTGRWSGQEPFGPTRQTAFESGPCAILTRAQLIPRKLITFWRAVPPVAAVLSTADGLRFARGIGEAPIGLQATISVWDDQSAATAFAYGTAAHRRVIRRTAETGWYAEQLFARFAVIDASGVVDGRDPLGVRSAAGAHFG